MGKGRLHKDYTNFVSQPGVLVGGLGNDALFGGDGEDKMYGGPGADTFIGGNETDIFVLTRNSFHIIDYFADFNPGVDKIGLLSGGWQRFVNFTTISPSKSYSD